jgi:selenocysteine-specific elongation factor
MSTSTRPSTFVVGTAGHIDHGKTSLVRALTGVDLDALPEERQRGITIALGFTSLELASGRRAAFVDVPGHERLVRTMIAGASGIDAVLLCVSAVEGVMPQTREHLDILGLLGVQRGLVVLTMADLVDEEMLELAQEDVADALEGSFLEGAPVLVSSAETGQGLPGILAAIDALELSPRGLDGPFRLPVDRAFLQRGFGAVVTGTALSGRVQDGDELWLLPSEEKVRVRGIQVHGEKCASSQAGLRTALNLAGVERSELPRGTVLATPGQVPVSSILDVRYRHLAGAPGLESGASVRLLVGTTEVMAVAHGLDGDLLPGAHRLLQLRTAEPLACLPGDRFVLRRESPVTTLGGGEVLDPWAPKVKRRDFERAALQLQRLADGDRGVLLERAGLSGLSQKEAAERGVEGLALGDRVLAPGAVAELEEALRAELDRFHEERPLALGAGRRSLRRARLEALSPGAFDALVARLTEAGEVEIEGPRLRRVGWQVRLDSTQQSGLDSLVAQLAASRWEGLKAQEIEGVEQLEELLALAQEWGQVDKAGPRFYASSALAELVAGVRGVLAQEGELSPGRFKELSGLARRGAIPLLEWLDARGVTKRRGDTRVAG